MTRRGGPRRGRKRLASARARRRLSSRRRPSVGRISPATASAYLDRSTIPSYPTPLIGRSEELSTLQVLLSRADVRLVTLTGPPGVGKTRLAVELAGLIADRFPHGVAFVDLAPLTATRLVLPRMLNALGIREGGSDVLTQLLRALRKKTLLLLLDNFEHVVDAAVSISEIVAHCPHVTVLVTSRIPLRLRGEHQVPVPPLPLPDLRAPPVLAELAGVPSVALFLERARGINPSFHLSSSHDALAAAGICARLDGLPLAIEIAAAHTQHLPVWAIWEHLISPWDQHSLRLLTGLNADLPRRHRTLFTAIAWSYNLLTPEFRMLFRRLGIFTGGFGSDAARAVCLDGDLQVDPREGLDALVDHHLLQCEHTGTEPRCRMLQTVREFALAQLQAEEESQPLRRRHAEFFLTLAERAEPHLWGPEQTTWLDRLELESDNLHSALDWSLSESGDKAIAERLGGALARFWDLAGRWDDGRRWLDRILAAVSGPSRQTVQMLVSRGYLSFVRADYPEALGFLREAQSQAQRLTDPSWGLAFSHLGTGAILCAQGDILGGLALLEDAARLGREREVRGAVTSALSFMGMVSLLRGDHQQADQITEECLANARREGNPHQLQHALIIRGLTLLITTKALESILTFQESLRVALGMKEKLGIAASLEGVGWAAVALGYGEAGTNTLAAAGSLREHLGGVESNLPTWRTYHEAALEQARRLLGESAFDVAWTIGSELPFEEVIALGLMSPVELSRQASRARAQRGNLSHRECQIVAEIIQGLTNREIGTKFKISRRTVDFHVQSILNKLGFSTRAQIAAWAVEHGFTRTAVWILSALLLQDIPDASLALMALT